jgi:GNAT superfamily N-acetyltransferase
VVVRSVQSSRDLRALIDLPYRLYAADPLWAPPLRQEIRTLLRRRNNPFFQHGDAELFLARRGGEVVGRIAAVTNQLHNETQRDRVGFFGFFESIDDQAVTDELLAAAARWVAQRGHDTLRGPASYSVNHEYGLLVDGYDSPPPLLTPYNPPYYAALLERSGLRKAKDLWGYQVGSLDLHASPPDRLSRGARAVARRLGLTVRRIDLHHLDREAETIRRVMNACWRENWGFVPITHDEVRQLTKQLRPIVIPDMVPFVEKDGETVGFALAVPDINHLLRSNRSGRAFPAALKILWSVWRRSIPRLRILLLGILPEYRGKGVDAMLWHAIWSRTEQNGFKWAEASWVLEDNVPMNNALERMTFSRYKTFRIYERAL